MNNENLYENLQQVLRHALQEGNFDEVLDIITNELRQARVYLSMDTGEPPRAGLRLAGWQEVDNHAQDFIMSDRRLRLWLGDQHDRTYSQSTLSSGAFERPSPDEYQSISLEELTPIPPHAILDLLAHTPTPPTPPTPPTLSPPPPAATTTTRPTTRPPGGFYPTWVPPPPPWFHEPTPEELIQAGLFLQRSIPIAIMSSIIIWFFHYIS
ncbi:hypothetical protein O0I10_001505 [Lichtheimia ornata]|uniref:Uncharacterized protein n=1 Tax=Lichtheimia ornata TaxID=688661 RepID=A0AAD7VAR8_9FUNG|nr:uncharacterized protein O0I10_001505 [Lichtheimia ornata]KAJ8662544.1 hypothetical protein O0I10_001505 [Lichtheimia ornata]